MKRNSNVIGIDIGSMTISVVEMSSQKQIVKSAYIFHHGDISEKLKNALSDFKLSEVSGIAATSSTPLNVNVDKRYNDQVSVISAAKYFYGKIGSILIVGGEKFGLIQFDNNGKYLNYRPNTSCAAGTGSFLDQQAGRLNLAGIEELSEIAFNNKGEIPKIASRCAVFAKTDLVHAQQEGYSLGEICDGLCYGLAKNISDTLFAGEKPNGPVVFAGGVSKNWSVVEHLSAIIKMDIAVDEMSNLYGAIGAALNLMDEKLINPGKCNSIDEIVSNVRGNKNYFHDPLELKLSEYPDFQSLEQYEYNPTVSNSLTPVEVDVYEDLKNSNVYLGIDIGSTSTKAILMDMDNTILAGFYTRTVGRPMDAVQAIFESIDNIIIKKNVDLKIIGAGTTGSGRKFIGKIIGADLIIDEITAHARAACEINPDVDTIIEIGGQDSKFTTLKDGMVTFSIMNAVCAAGTGSFIEELANRLGCPLTEYSSRTEYQRAPIASDRCTVFMERDINHYISEGYTVDEVLASILHSIRENYLTKVAVESNIGETILFQGATAKNRALVAAFEQKLGKPIIVSKFCHITGAIGAALILSEEGLAESGFRGIDIYKKNIPIKSEVCELCTNHCKITIAKVDCENSAYGFLCGRDYDTKKFINNNTSGFDLIKQRKNVSLLNPKTDYREYITVGIPAALHLVEDLPLWEKFFHELSIKTVTSNKYNTAVKDGKNLTGAEFCAPISALHGHVDYLMDKADYIFLPLYLDRKTKEKGKRRQYCYYTQFMPSLISTMGEHNVEKKLLSPLVNYIYSDFYTKMELYRMLKSITRKRIGFFEVSAAYDRAVEFHDSCIKKLQSIYKEESRSGDDINVVFFGRPYTVLSPFMNNGIPDIFASLGIKTFYQDMLSYTKKDLKSIEALLKEVHWLYGAKILEATEVIAQTEGAYPVLITSFKCAPDSFIIEYYKKIMESHGKPYLVLQLDEHDSSVGYETRIESAIRSFRNHHSVKKKSEFINYPSIIKPEKVGDISGKTLLVPNWDNISMDLVVSALRKEGVDARLLDENETAIQKSMKHNTGQCIPLNVIAQNFIDYVENHNLAPEDTVLWMISSEIACNIKLYPHHMKNIIDKYGSDMSKAGVYTGDISFIDISKRAPINVYFAFMFGGLLRKMGCRIRPYEVENGKTDDTIKRSIKIFKEAFDGKRTRESAVAEVVSEFEDIEVIKEERPKVAIFGDLYARDNEVMNQELIRFIEANGGEVITTPYNYFVKMVSGSYIRKWFIEGKYYNVISSKAILSAINFMEKKYYRYFERILKEPEPKFNVSTEKILSEYNIRIENTGESMENILKIFYIMKHYPDTSLFVQTNPAFCCPSIVTEAMAKEIERKTGVPVVSLTYDGTGGYKNEVIIPYLKYSRRDVQEDSLMELQSV